MSTPGPEVGRGVALAAWVGAALWVGLLGGGVCMALQAGQPLVPSSRQAPGVTPAQVAAAPAPATSAPVLCSAQPQRFVLADPGVVRCNPGAVRVRLRRGEGGEQAEWLSVQGDSLATGLRLVVEPAAAVASHQVWQLGEGRGGTYQLRHRASGGWLSVLWDGSVELSPGQVTSWSPQLTPHWILQPVLRSAQSAAAGTWLTLSYWTSGKRLAAAEREAAADASAADALPTAWLVSPASHEGVPWTQQWRLEDVAGQPCRLP